MQRVELASRIAGRIRDHADARELAKAVLADALTPETGQAIARADGPARASPWSSSARPFCGDKDDRLTPLYHPVGDRCRCHKRAAGLRLCPRGYAETPRVHHPARRGGRPRDRRADRRPGLRRRALVDETAGGAKLDSMFTLHPAMATTAGLYAGKQAHFAHAVATGYRDRSHFDGQNMLKGGGSRPYGRDSGWVGRLLTLLPPPSEMRSPSRPRCRSRFEARCRSGPMRLAACRRLTAT